ncbi:NADP-dependent oxidoreductase domain-containing protein [Xylariales sp. PMI_506]|nr:NADP-dependent oxidoreductase domain-containing protein [Xylariales sp. PMI_506]
MSSNSTVKFILGTMSVGDSTKLPGCAHFDDEKDVKALLDAFYDRGYKELDTARAYSEERLGQVGAASRYILHTKVKSGQPGDHEPANIEISIAQSLKALDTSSVETMFLHVPTRDTPFEDTIEAMHKAQQQGNFKNFGLDSYTAAEVQKFIDICEEKGYPKPSVYEGGYNALIRSGEKDLFPILRKHNISFFAFSPAAGGLCSGERNPASTRWSYDNFVGKIFNSFYDRLHIHAAAAAIREAAEKHGINGHEAALRWTAFHSLLDAKYGDAVIIGASKVEHVHKALNALEAGPLPAELASDITAVYATIEHDPPSYHI